MEGREARLSRENVQDNCDYKGKWFAIRDGHFKREIEIPARTPMPNQATNGNKLNENAEANQVQAQGPVEDNSDMSDKENKLTPEQMRLSPLKQSKF